MAVLKKEREPRKKKSFQETDIPNKNKKKWVGPMNFVLQT